MQTYLKPDEQVFVLDNRIKKATCVVVLSALHWLRMPKFKTLCLENPTLRAKVILEKEALY